MGTRGPISRRYFHPSQPETTTRRMHRPSNTAMVKSNLCRAVLYYIIECAYRWGFRGRSAGVPSQQGLACLVDVPGLFICTSREGESMADGIVKTVTDRGFGFI